MQGMRNGFLTPTKPCHCETPGATRTRTRPAARWPDPSILARADEVGALVAQVLQGRAEGAEAACGQILRRRLGTAVPPPKALGTSLKLPMKKKKNTPTFWGKNPFLRVFSGSRGFLGMNQLIRDPEWTSHFSGDLCPPTTVEGVLHYIKFMAIQAPLLFGNSSMEANWCPFRKRKFLKDVLSGFAIFASGCITLRANSSKVGSTNDAHARRTGKYKEPPQVPSTSRVGSPL